MFAWSSEPCDDGAAPLLHRGHDRALGIPGYLAREEEWRRLLDADDPGAVADELGGVFGVFGADPLGFTAVTTAVRVDPVYHAVAGEAHIAGNRALLVHLARLALVGDGAPVVRFDTAAIASLLRHGFFIGEETPFEGVRALPAHSTLRARLGVVELTTRKMPVGRSASLVQRRRQIAALGDGLIDAVAPLAACSGPLVLSLTGGRDSRMIAAALYAAGIEFQAFTKGAADDPDVVVAARVARALGVAHSSKPPALNRARSAVRIDDPLIRTQRAIRATEGMLSTVYNLAPASAFRISPHLTGPGGEQLRGGYLAAVAELSPCAIQKRVRSTFTRYDRFQTEWARELALAAYKPWGRHARRDPLDALDRMYLYDRSGRWAGGSRMATSLAGVMLYPLFDNILTRRAMAMAAAWRWTEVPIYRTIARLAPVLRDVPLAKKRWRFSPAEPPLFGRRRWLSQAPVTAAPTGQGGFDWRVRPDAALVAVLREQILDGPASLFDLVERSAIEQLLATMPLEEPHFVWHLYTASVLLSGSWVMVPARRPHIEVAIEAMR